MTLVDEAAIELQQKSRPVTATISFYRPELDALRFLAFLMVFMHHGLPHDPLKYGMISHNPHVCGFFANIAIALGAGLPLFFVLSAYLIASLLLREREKTSTVHVSAFYIRRMLRIWPLYFAALLASFLASRFIAGFHEFGVYIVFLFMAGNWTHLFSLTSVGGSLGIGHLWSISVEEQFYMAFPCLAKFLNKRALLILCFGMGIAALATLAYLAHVGQELGIIWRNSFVEFLMFACGIALGVKFSGERLPDFRAGTRFSLICGAPILCVLSQTLCGINGAGVCHSTAKIIGGYLLMAAGCSCLLLSTIGTTRKVPGALVYLGKITYGLYVFHPWCLELARYVIARLHPGVRVSEGAMVLLEKDGLGLALTILAATLSYQLFEAPFLKLKDHFAFIHSRPV